MTTLPRPEQNDPDAVVTALEVGASMWARGEHAEAVKWLRKAVDEAFDAGLDARAVELSKLVAAIAAVPASTRPAAVSQSPEAVVPMAGDDSQSRLTMPSEFPALVSATMRPSGAPARSAGEREPWRVTTAVRVIVVREEGRVVVRPYDGPPTGEACEAVLVGVPDGERLRAWLGDERAT